MPSQEKQPQVSFTTFFTPLKALDALHCQQDDTASFERSKMNNDTLLNR